MTNKFQSLSEDQFKYLKTIESEWTQAYIILNDMPSLTLTVYGGAKLLESDKDYKDTVQICHKLSKQGWGIVSGGGPGAMKAAIIGGGLGGAATTAFKIDLSREHTKDIASNNYLFTNFPPRKHALRQSDAYLVVPGGWGTFDELFEVVTLQKVDKIAVKPIILYGKSFWTPMIEWITKEVLSKGLVKQSEIDSLIILDSVDEVVNYLSVIK